MDMEELPWDYYLEKWPYTDKPTTRIMSIRNKIEEHFSRKIALPDQYRSTIWRTVEHLDKLMGNPENKDIYQHQLTIFDEEIESDVKTDVARTYPSSDYKSKLKLNPLSNSKKSLYNVLKAYANYNGEVRYTQGMNYLALVLLCYFDEEQSFWMMDILIKKHGMRHFFRKNNTLLPSYLKIFENELWAHLPKLSRHLHSSGVKVYMFVQSWWSTIFVYILPVESISIVWDYFFWGSNSNGMAIEVLFRLSIALLKLLEQYLLCDGLSQIFETIRNKTPLMDPLELVYLAKEITLTDETCKFLRDKATALSVQEDGLVLSISPDTANNNQTQKQQQQQQKTPHPFNDKTSSTDSDEEDTPNIMFISDDEESIGSIDGNDLYMEEFERRRGGTCIIN